MSKEFYDKVLYLFFWFIGMMAGVVLLSLGTGLNLGRLALSTFGLWLIYKSFVMRYKPLS